MQDRYAGDIGDFVKLGLLRAISEGISLGIAWYRYPDESHNGDGRHIDYLKKHKTYEPLDPELFGKLQSMVDSGDRSIDALEGCLQIKASSKASLDVTSIAFRGRRGWRNNWFQGVLSDLKDCELVFADPDNGITEDADKRKGRKDFGKRIPLQECVELAMGRCAVIYHHNTRRLGGHDAEVNHWLNALGGKCLAVRATAYSPRTFFILNATPNIVHRVRDFCGRWAVAKVRLHGAN